MFNCDSVAAASSNRKLGLKFTNAINDTFTTLNLVYGADFSICYKHGIVNWYNCREKDFVTSMCNEMSFLQIDFQC